MVVGLLFRWTSLMLIESIIAASASSPWVLLCTSALLLAGVWTEVLQRFIFRFQFGSGDTQLRLSAGRQIETQVIFDVATTHKGCCRCSVHALAALLPAG